MARVTKSGALKRAIVKCATANSNAIDAVRTLLESRTTKCDPDCPGWFINEIPERCDDCARLNGYLDVVGDDMIALLPEVHTASGTAGLCRATDQPTRNEARVIGWLRDNVGARYSDVYELASKRSCKLAAELLRVTPQWVAHQVLKVK